MKTLLLRVKGPLEVDIYLVRRDCKVMQVIGDRHSILERIMPKEGVTDHLVKVGEFTNEMGSQMRLAGIRVMKLGESKIWARAPSCSGCRYLMTKEVMILRAWPLSKDEIVYRLIVPSMGYLKDLLKELNDMGMKPRVLKSNLMSMVKNRGLTPRQLQILMLAYRKGYFAVDRRLTLKELSDILEISPASAEELMRRALGKVVEDFLRSLDE